ncbi:hypothetical protein [Ekhidna sp.]|uniref:hypothetical protein n=1 Tax=Ekhidna sp. TaxID=2608089 RepID=UPI003297457D
MKKLLFLSLIAMISCKSFSQGENENAEFKSSGDLKITKAQVVHDGSLEHLVFSITVKGTAGKSVPTPAGQLDGAPVLGYVFPTNLKSTDVGFGETAGIVALALTSHPDFDDTPLWDENFDQNYANDGIIWHPHWVVLIEDKRLAGGLAVKQFDPEKEDVTLPPTNPGMPMYMDSPGFHVVSQRNQIKVIVPTYRVSGKTDFMFDGVAAYMQVNTSKTDLPMLGVYAVYSVASGDLSLPYTVEK